MVTLIKSDHMVSIYLLSFKKRNHKYAILDNMTFLFIVKWPYENQYDHIIFQSDHMMSLVCHTTVLWSLLIPSVGIH